MGHKRLLLRSVKSSEAPTRVDVLFKNVAKLSLPTTLKGLIVEPASVEVVRTLAHGSESFPMEDRTMFLIRGDGYDGYVVAGAMAHLEDIGEYDEESRLLLTA